MISRDYIKEKIESLPDDSLEEVLDFIEFLEARKGKESETMLESTWAEEIDPLAGVIGICEGPPDLAERHNEYVYGVRQADSCRYLGVAGFSKSKGYLSQCRSKELSRDKGCRIQVGYLSTAEAISLKNEDRM